MFSFAKRSDIKHITVDQFNDGRDPRFGTANPEKTEIAYWKLAARYCIDPWQSRVYFLKGEEPEDSASERSVHEDSNCQKGEDYVGSEDGTADQNGAKVKDREDENADDDESKVQDGDDYTGSEDDGDSGTSELEDYSFMKRNAIWCALRFGQTTTKLPDGTTVKIPGEHEDFYDPDFQVYNDVFVYAQGSSGAKGATSDFHIYGYPEAVFPQTDFHTATYIPQLHRILVLGNMSSGEVDDALAARGITPVYLLEVGTWRFEKKETHGEGPGIIWQHMAELTDDGLRVTTAGASVADHEKTKRKVFKEGKSELIEVEPDTVWKLSLEDWTWKLKASESTVSGQEDERTK